MFSLKFGEPFSFLNSSLLTDEIFKNHQQNKEINGEQTAPSRYNEFGFLINDDDDDEKEETNEIEYQKNKSRWIAYLGQQYDKFVPVSDYDVSQFDINLTRLPILEELISLSIPNDLRAFFWLRFSKAFDLKASSQWSFPQLIDLSASVSPIAWNQISQILPNNICFHQSQGENSISICCQRLNQILGIIKWYQKTNLLIHQEEDDTCQMNFSLIGAYLLLICNQEDAFWLLLKINIELNNIDAFVQIIEQIMEKCCPIVYRLLCRHDIQFELISVNWFQSLFADNVHNPKLLYFLWDLYFYEGPAFLIQITTGLLIIETKLLESCSDSKEFFNTLSDLPANSFKCREKILYAWRSGRNIVANLNLDPTLFHYEIINPATPFLMSPNLSTTNGTSLFNFGSGSLKSEPYNEQELKMKNIKQTALIMSLHEAIVTIAQHFQAYDSSFKFSLEADYDNVDRVDSRDDLNNRLRPYQRRAKALIDFERDDPDELGFLKNDIITVISEKDEHCWIGEMNGEIGWFPAQFVEILDERDQNYCIAGDDRVVPFINDLVRGKLCQALKAILTYDMRKSYFFNIHPWTIIEEIVMVVANIDLKSVYSRLTLTKTFRLDEYARVLSPSELLYKSIVLINHTHDKAPMDIKLRSLVCFGLNQYVLHDWFELICTLNRSVIQKSYGPSSFLTTPAWKMIKAELKLLVQFSFHLNPDVEIDEGHETKSPVIKDGVCDMLFKYHLFSWDI